MVDLVGWFFFCERIGSNADGLFYRCCPNKIGFLGPYICLFRRSLAGHPEYTSIRTKIRSIWNMVSA